MADPQNDTQHDCQQQLRDAQAEITRLQQELSAQRQHIQRLMLWMQGLQRDINDVYHSVTWLAGNVFTRIILFLLGRKAGITARDHVERVAKQFETWRVHYVQTTQADDLPSFAWHEPHEYQQWLLRYDTPTAKDYTDYQQTLQSWQTHPLISLLMILPTEEINQSYLNDCLKSITQQIYPYWELCLLPEGEWAKAQTDYTDTRIRLVDDFSQASGEFVAQVEAHDCLPLHALYNVVAHLQQHPHATIIYTDNDFLDATGQRYNPYFKPDWNPDLFYSQAYLNALVVYRRAILPKKPDYTNHYALALACITQINTRNIHHLPQILYHQRTPATRPQASNTDILRTHLQTHAPQLQVFDAIAGHTRVIYPLPTPKPSLSVIIPTRDRLNLLRNTINGLLEKTDYTPLEILIIDNGSIETNTLEYFKEIQKDEKIRVIRHVAPFNYSELNNLGVQQAKGEMIALLNNDLAMIHPDWLREMVSHAYRTEVGAVGAKLYYINNTLQHAGVVVGLGGMAGHAFKHVSRQAQGYHWKPFLIQNYTAVTAACLVMRRAVFLEIGGLDAKHLSVAFNDVDLCLRLGEAGYRIVWTPYAELYHLESASRGLDTTPRKYWRLRSELNYMQKRWGNLLANDPCYNPNLTVQYEDFSLAYPPRLP
ncbi:glycosyltransferase family 2 protein [Beggiatoa leptomitoformis]|uniref:Glycosyltransferase n=1 Tax=Beggiatoa leptomitoformis TaxID=288004 RepID=A0A2N9YET6_9GAMM|nr:glycosyltransferase family 2 protein [Beggiatoa leptomitoformis]AUI68997.1 glycosyltransferase [Beggiatoa leptomitoformis]QGX03769.1 glycosyltransferase [Beggiatoa leptomitoformis]